LIQSSELMAITQYYGHCGLLEIEVRRFWLVFKNERNV
jgi:hypothetical protein